MKKISFIIPNYNGENTIGKVIESIKNQNYNYMKPIEIAKKFGGRIEVNSKMKLTKENL